MFIGTHMNDEHAVLVQLYVQRAIEWSIKWLLQTFDISNKYKKILSEFNYSLKFDMFLIVALLDSNSLISP